MAGLGFLYGLVVLVAGVLIAVGLVTEQELWLGLGFALLACCTIVGVNPGIFGRKQP